MPYDRTPVQRNGPQPSLGPSLLAGLTTAAITAAVATDRRTNPSGYRNAEVERVLQTRRRIPTRPATPIASRRLRTGGRATIRGERLGKAIARAAPTRRPNAR